LRKGQTWPEIPRGMREAGILDMEIYIAGTHLFMIMDTVPDFDHNTAFAELAKKPRQAEWLLSLAGSNSAIKGVVGWVDLRSADVYDQLQKYSEHPLINNIRFYLKVHGVFRR